MGRERGKRTGRGEKSSPPSVLMDGCSFLRCRQHIGYQCYISVTVGVLRPWRLRTSGAC